MHPALNAHLPLVIPIYFSAHLGVLDLASSTFHYNKKRYPLKRTPSTKALILQTTPLFHVSLQIIIADIISNDKPLTQFSTPKFQYLKCLCIKTKECRFKFIIC